MNNIMNNNMRFESYMESKFDPLMNYNDETNKNWLNPDKPKGMWLSTIGTDDNWRSWLKYNEMFCHNERYWKQFDVDMKNILCITNDDEFIKFDKKYVIYKSKYQSKVIWDDIYKQYDGIAIIPHFSEFHLTHDWYYMWDCASVCIWNLDVVSLCK